LSTTLAVPILDPDSFARQHGDVAAPQFTGSRQMLAQVRSSLLAGESFGIETTLSGQTAFRIIAKARDRHYDVILVYLGTDDVRINLARIELRVATGGHSVPEVDVRRRYARSLANLGKALKMVARAILIDNTSDVAEERFRIAAIDEVGTTKQFGVLPAWLESTSLPGRAMEEWP
jgi:predicted ABC-type ATPase